MPSRSYTSEPMVRNSILLVFDAHSDCNFVDAVVDRDGTVSRLDKFTHLGFTSDSVLLYDGELGGRQSIDIRYFPAASREGKYIEFYSFDTDGLPVYLHNAGDTTLSFLAPDGLIDIEPGERKLACEENMAADSRERLERYSEEAREKLRRLLGRPEDRKSTRLNSSHLRTSRMPSSA